MNLDLQIRTKNNYSFSNGAFNMLYSLSPNTSLCRKKHRRENFCCFLSVNFDLAIQKEFRALFSMILRDYWHFQYLSSFHMSYFENKHIMYVHVTVHKIFCSLTEYFTFFAYMYVSRVFVYEKNFHISTI